MFLILVVEGRKEEESKFLFKLVKRPEVDGCVGGGLGPALRERMVRVRVGVGVGVG